MDWLRNAIVEGFQGLIALNLDHAPTADALKAMVTVWVRTLQDAPVMWDEQQDRERIRRAFRILAATTERWPAPATFLHVLPPRVELKRLTPPTSTKMPPEIRAQLNAFLTKGKAA